MNKKVLIVKILAFVWIFGVAQSSKETTGRIVYKVSSGKRVTLVEMLFTHHEYAYRLAELIDTVAYPFSLETGRGQIKAFESKMNTQQLSIQDMNAYVGNFTFVIGSWASQRLTTAALLGIERKNQCTYDTLIPIKWNLFNSLDTVLGRHCGKADGKDPRTGSNFEAWYDVAIPTIAAPFQMAGLPGLLIRAKNMDTNNEIVMIELQYPYHSKFEKFTSYCKDCKLVSIANAMIEDKKKEDEIERLLKRIQDAKDADKNKKEDKIIKQ